MSEPTKPPEPEQPVDRPADRRIAIRLVQQWDLVASHECRLLDWAMLAPEPPAEGTD
jgi:hypothetical protein